jgi:hypothetical protein
VVARAEVNRSSTAFFEELRSTWARAAERADAVEMRSYRVADRNLELRFAGDALVAPLGRALAHLPPGDPALDTLVVHAWESETTRTPMPRPPWGPDDYREHGRIRGYFDEHVHSVFQWGSRSLVMLDLERNEALYWIASARQIPYFEMAAPLRLVLHGWLSERGLELVHAAAVGSPEGCVLLVGNAGSGKSWGALSSLAVGLRLLADDYCLVRGGTPPRVASIYSTAKTHGDAFERLPFLEPMVSNPVRHESDKAVYFLHEHVPDRLLLESDLRAILVPRRSGERGTAVRPAPPAAGLAAFAPSTILQLPASGARTLQRLAEVVRAVPCYYLELGTDLETIPNAITSILEATSEHVDASVRHTR